VNQRVEPRTVGVATAALATIIGACFALLAVALGRPGHAEQLVVRTVAQLTHYTGSQTTMTLNGEHLTTVCRQESGGRGHVERVTLDDSHTLVVTGGKLVQTSTRALDEFELAGCPQSLASWITDQLNQGAQVNLEPARVDGTRVYKVRLVTSSGLGLALYIDRSGGLPVELAISGGGLRGASDVSYGLPPPDLTRALGLRFK